MEREMVWAMGWEDEKGERLRRRWCFKGGAVNIHLCIVWRITAFDYRWISIYWLQPGVGGAVIMGQNICGACTKRDYQWIWEWQQKIGDAVDIREERGMWSKRSQCATEGWTTRFCKIKHHGGRVAWEIAFTALKYAKCTYMYYY